MDMEIVDKALSKAKVQILSRPDSAFFTYVLLSLEHKWDEKCSTAYTNGKVLGFNPGFFMSLDQEERIFVLLHEVLHVAYMHMMRLLDHDPCKWNIAADHVINLKLIESGYKMPKIGLADQKYAGLHTEAVYKLLPEDPPEDYEMDLQDPGSDMEEARKDVENILVQAAIQTKMKEDGIGSIPGEIRIFLEKLLNPKLPWFTILRKYLNNMSKEDYSFRKPNRRYFPDHYLPSLHSEKLINLAIGVDASGSVQDKDFLVFISETNAILNSMKPDKISLITFDTDIRSVDTIKSVSELSKVKFTGRGGTNVSPLIDWANTNRPNLLLVFTDGEFYFYDLEPTMPTLWLIHNNPDFTAPYGKVIHYGIE